MASQKNTKKVEYRVVAHWVQSKFEEEVTDFLNRGWVPVGGVVVNFTDGGSVRGYSQALTKTTHD